MQCSAASSCSAAAAYSAAVHVLHGSWFWHLHWDSSLYGGFGVFMGIVVTRLGGYD
mgnify:CR=1 FL=1